MPARYAGGDPDELLRLARRRPKEPTDEEFEAAPSSAAGRKEAKTRRAAQQAARKASADEAARQAVAEAARQEAEKAARKAREEAARSLLAERDHGMAEGAVAAAGAAAVGVWWAGKLLSPACGPAVLVCAAVL